MSTSTSTISIEAPADKVWRALTDPELVKQWQYGSELETTWKVGSPIRFRSEWQGQVFEQWGTVLEVEPNHLVRYSLFAPRPDLEDRPENYFIMSYKLDEHEGGTQLTVVQEGNRPGTGNEDTNGEDENGILAGA